MSSWKTPVNILKWTMAANLPLSFKFPSLSFSSSSQIFTLFSGVKSDFSKIDPRSLMTNPPFQTPNPHRRKHGKSDWLTDTCLVMYWQNKRNVQKLHDAPRRRKTCMQSWEGKGKQGKEREERKKMGGEGGGGGGEHFCIHLSKTIGISGKLPGDRRLFFTTIDRQTS